MKIKKNGFVLWCIIVFLIISVLSFIFFLFYDNSNAYEMRNILKDELLLLENTLKEHNIIEKEVSYGSNSADGEYWISDDVSDIDDAIFVYMGFTYEQLFCEVDLRYQDDIYAVVFTFGNTDLSCLEDETKAGAEKLLDIFNAFCNTVSFSPNIVEKNYSETYFTNYYEQEKYDALSSNKQHGINEMCSYKVATQKDSYTYFCSKDSDGNLFPCQISIACNRTVDKELLLEKDGSGND